MKADRFESVRCVLRAVYPGWEGIDDPRFVSDEIEYKRQAIQRASVRLSQRALTDLVEREQFAEVIDRLKEIGGEPHFLYLATPATGDLAVLHDPSVDQAELAPRILDLLHGDGASPARLDRFSDWLERQGLPNKWAFSTFFLYLTDPDHNVFVKPRSVGQFLDMIHADLKLASRPEGRVYRQLLAIADQVQAEVLSGHGDRVHAQSVIWVTGSRNSKLGAQALTHERQRTLARLLDEFGRTYLGTEEGAAYLSRYPEIRETARRNFAQVIAARDDRQDVTDLVLTGLLPHRDSAPNRARGAWIHVAPAISTDVRTRFETAGWVAPEDWPDVSRTILDFVDRVVKDPGDLETACSGIAKSEYGKGFQTGMLTPVVSALVPDQLVLINNKSRAVVNHFLELNYGQSIRDYPELNTAAHYLINRLREVLLAVVPQDVTPQETFDAFCHWLVAIKGYRFGRTQAWRIAIEDSSVWNLWVEGGYAGLTEPALPNVGSIKKQQWDEERAAALTSNPNASGERFDEVRALATAAQEGDLVVATRGQGRALGVGMVVGPYEYHDRVEPQHRVPVAWQDTDPRAISEPGWKARFQAIDPTTVEKLKELPGVTKAQEQGAFSRRAFELLAGIRENPTRDYYNKHLHEFRAQVEEPLKELMKGVAALLPQAMKEVLETEKRLFSRIPKNDFGLGGAWTFYWGAFHPKGGKRISSAQLFLSIRADRLEYGFALGQYAEEQYDRFMANLRRRRDAVIAAVSSHVETSDLVFGLTHAGDDVRESGRRGLSIRQWLSGLDGGETSVRALLSPEDVLSVPEAELRDRILEIFQQLFPLVLLATSDDPLEAISEYWGMEDNEEDLQPAYSLEQCATDTGFDAATLRNWVHAVKRKRQAIFYGPPGTGKTFMAEHIATHLVGGGDGFIEFVQFHPAYAYEDFIQGIRPLTRGDGALEYEMVPGRFLEFCRRAQNRTGPCVLIIDEINRANLARVFGELMYLLEYRNVSMPLAGGGTLRVPENVRVLGTMNTADRSIALVDHALRRRFAFVPMRPEFEILRSFHDQTGKSVDTLIEKLTQINKAIADPNYHLGITFFMDTSLESNLETIWRMEIEPYLEECFFDDPSTVARFRWDRICDELTV